ncbi:DUF4388 domain-containing protein [Merismopedia glauca]|uniref:PatA-like N-terminal domain-containing protein n=1 Tax=Merismopedia glauca CCAP 1448/3 TaxID=1296344 RepID=A0A2T1C9N7_9CYAN|nr:DUF4388 domain-containing protein [Merismopedia glauca]PSB04878.1 hypothetical protein C7B64_01965 [Merismopedia glauca CCAP 1448/3]
MAMVGNLEDFSISDLFHMLERGSKSGQLSLWAPTGIYRIWFYQGRVIGAISPKKEHSLKSLIASHQIGNPRLTSYIENIGKLREPLGTHLTKQGLIMPNIIAKVFRQQLEVSLYNLFSLSSGQFAFVQELALPYEEMTGMSRGAVDIAMEGLRKLEVVNQSEKFLPQPDSRFIKLTEELPLFPLCPIEWNVWEMIVPEKCLRDISSHLRADLLEVRRAASRLVRVGLVEEISADFTPPAKVATSNLEDYDAAIKTLVDTPKESQPKETVNTKLLSRLVSILKNVH